MKIEGWLVQICSEKGCRVSQKSLEGRVPTLVPPWPKILPLGGGPHPIHLWSRHLICLNIALNYLYILLTMHLRVICVSDSTFCWLVRNDIQSNLRIAGFYYSSLYALVWQVIREGLWPQMNHLKISSSRVINSNPLFERWKIFLGLLWFSVAKSLHINCPDIMQELKWPF